MVNRIDGFGEAEEVEGPAPMQLGPYIGTMLVALLLEEHVTVASALNGLGLGNGGIVVIMTGRDHDLWEIRTVPMPDGLTAELELPSDTEVILPRMAITLTAAGRVRAEEVLAQARAIGLQVIIYRCETPGCVREHHRLSWPCG